MNHLNQIKAIVDGLNQFFEPAVSPETQKDCFPWNSVVQYLKKHTEVVLAARNAPIFCTVFIKILETHPRADITICSAIIDLITVLLLENGTRENIPMWIFGDEYRIRDDYEHFFRRKREQYLACLLEKPQVSVFPVNECLPVVNAIRTGNHRLMQVLATNGYNATISNSTSSARKLAATMIPKVMSILDYEEIINNRAGYVIHHNGLYEFLDIAANDSSGGVQPYLNSYDLVRLGLDPFYQPKSASFKRLFLITLGIYALWLKLTNNRELTNFLKCLDIYFKTISEPYLTVSEVRSLFIKYFTHKHKEHLLDEWCTVFTDIMPFCTRNKGPRRLCHLARCQVRENLCKNGSTLTAILDQVEIPKSIKEFLLCKPPKKTLNLFSK